MVLNNPKKHSAVLKPQKYLKILINMDPLCSPNIFSLWNYVWSMINFVETVMSVVMNCVIILCCSAHIASYHLDHERIERMT